jgi:hypothetical protein
VQHIFDGAGLRTSQGSGVASHLFAVVCCGMASQRFSVVLNHMTRVSAARRARPRSDWEMLPCDRELFWLDMSLDVCPQSDIFAVMTEKLPPQSAPDPAASKETPADGSTRELSPAAQRALAEAEARRAEIDRKANDQPTELNGRGGPDPARYGDWEVKGIASDF